ncbi:putative histone deacetylase hda2, partial [Operophtera brumata]
MSTPPLQQPRRSGGDGKKVTPPSTIVTRNGARKAKIQTRAVSAGAKGPTGFVTEPRMAEHKCLWDNNYPECHELSLIDQCKTYEPRAATKDELCVLHSPSVYEMMEATHQNQDLAYLEEISSKYDAVYIHPSTGTCTTDRLRNRCSTMIPVDWDVHHGQATQQMFYDDPRCSTMIPVDWVVHHGQATQQMFYDDPSRLGRAPRTGYARDYQPELIIISAGYDAAYGCPEVPSLSILHVDSISFSPELVLVSAGFDAALGDEKGEMELTPACYATLLHMLMCVQPRVCCVLEGGYCVPSLAEGAALSLRTLLGHAHCITTSRVTMTDLTVPRYAVSYIYDQAMLKHTNICEPGHPECPERIMRIHERHRDFGLLERVHQLIGRPADDSEILTVHTQQHLDRLKELASTKLRALNNQKKSYDSVYFHPDTLEIDSVLTRHSNSAVCVVRPPGHHADEDTPSGFCLLNNAAIAANYAIDKHGLKRVLILDWDVHHGNGTQRITYEDNRILYMSLHRYDHGSFFPHSRDADHGAVGEGRGEGFNVNVPWNKMTQYLRGLAAGRVVLVLEGGYNVTSIAYAMTMCTKALLGDPIARHHDSRPCHRSAVETINNVINTHKKYWKSLKFQLSLPAEDVLEPPLPSRGLTDDHNITCETEKSISLDDTNKSVNTGQLESSLEVNMASLSLDTCSDGIHCGTDTEDDSPKQFKSKDRSPKRVCVLAPNSSDDSSRNVLITIGPGKLEGTSQNVSNSSRSEKLEGSPKNVNISGSDNPEQGPSCTPEKTTLVDYLADNMQAIVDGEMFAVIPLPWCRHLEALSAIPSDVHFAQGVKCIDCDETVENWVCLHCYVTACARGVRGHMQQHYARSAHAHALALSLADLSVWCSACDAYIDHALLYDAKNNAHRAKFGEDMPWCYPDDTIRME